MARKTLQAIARDLQVMNYLDYRDFLRDLYERSKASTSPYSYEVFAVELGLPTTNALRLVIAHQRLLADNTAQIISKSLGLRKGPRKYFIALVRHINARSPGLKERYLRKMLEIKQASTASGQARDQMDYYTDWSHPVIREMLRLADLESSPEAMAERFFHAVGPERIRKSLALLAGLGLTATDPVTGKIQVQDTAIVLPSDATTGHLVIATYHQAMIDAAKEAVSRVPEEQSEFNALTVALSVAEFKELRQRVKDFCSEVMARDAKEQTRECVAQINIQLFSLTKWKGPTS